MAYHDGHLQNEAENIEIVDLPDSELDVRSIYLLAFGRRFQSFARTPHFSLIPACLITMLLLVLLSGSQLYQRIIPSSRQHGTSEASSLLIISNSNTPGQTNVTITNSNGAWITSDGKSNTTQQKTVATCKTGTHIGAIQSVGNYPVWVKGLFGPQAHIILPISAYQASPWFGWNITLQVAAIYNFHQPITLSVFSTQDEFPAAFATAQPNTYNTSITLDTQTPTQRNVPDGDKFRNIWNVTLHIPQDGCYGLMADWSISTWSILFTAQQ